MQQVHNRRLRCSMHNSPPCSLFTEEDTENLPQLNKRFPSLSILNVTAIGVEKLLLNLNTSKAAGPDKLSGKLLKATAHEIAPLLQVIFQRSINEGTLPQAWGRKLQSHRCTRRSAEVIQLITVQSASHVSYVRS